MIVPDQEKCWSINKFNLVEGEEVCQLFKKLVTQSNNKYISGKESEYESFLQLINPPHTSRMNSVRSHLRA